MKHRMKEKVCVWGGGMAIFSSVVQRGIMGGGMGVSHVDTWKEHSRQRERQTP